MRGVKRVGVRRSGADVAVVGGHPFHRIVVGYDGTATGIDALRLAAELAEPAAGEVVVAAVYDHDNEFAELVEARLTEGLALLPRRTGARAAAADGSPARGLREIAAAEEADLLVVGATHRGAVARATVGGVGEHLLHGAPCPVAVAPAGYAQDPAEAPELIAVAYDGSPEARSALALATRLALEARARIRLIGVVELQPILGYTPAANYAEVEREARDALRARLEAAALELPYEVGPETALGKGSAAEQIITRLGRAGMLVTGSRGYGPLRRVLLGSVSAALAHAAPVPLLITPRGAPATRSGDSLSAVA